MRKLIIVNMMSLDGYYTGSKEPEKPDTVLPFDDAFHAYDVERMKTASTVLLGHNSYKEFSSFWPSLADDPDATPNPRKFAKLYNKIEKVVVSNKMTSRELKGPWKDTTRIISHNVYDEVKKLQKEDGKDIVMWASRMLWSDLVAHGIVAELHIILGNVVVGAGTPLFKDVHDVSLHNIGTPRKLPNSENVLIKYELRPPCLN